LVESIENLKFSLQVPFAKPHGNGDNNSSYIIGEDEHINGDEGFEG